MSELKSGVYLLESTHKGISLLKIGYSKDVFRRVKTHKTSNPLIKPIGYIQTSFYKEYEKLMHKKCIKYKYTDEWFFDKDAIRQHFLNHTDFKTI